MLPKRFAVIKATRDETHAKISTLKISCEPLKDLDSARDAPKIEEISAWLSLDGIEKSHAKTVNTMTDMRVASTPIFVLSPNLAREKTLSATELFIIYDKIAPRKLKTAHKEHACHIFKAPVPTTEEIAFGASVNPFKNTTVSVKTSIVAPNGVLIFSEKSEKLTLSPHKKIYAS
jgi:hypothetical protein